MEAMTDVAKILGEFLQQSGTSLNQSVGSRIWSPVVPKGFQNSQPALVFHVETSPESASGVMASEVVFKVYGGSSSLAAPGEVGGRLYSRLHLSSGNVASGSLVHGQCLSISGILTDPETGWPYRIDRYRIITR